LGRNRESIESGDCRVLFVDECHLLSGDIQGYVWGRRGEGVEVPLVNERERQTYYGALDLKSKQVFLEAHRQGDTQSTLEYLRFLQEQLPGKRLVILWDGASYHRAKEIRSFLAEVNEGLDPDEWRIHCIQFAPNDPRQNPIEDVWLRAKNWLRRMSGLKPCFKAMKAIFEDFFKLEVFDFPKMHQYGPHS